MASFCAKFELDLGSEKKARDAEVALSCEAEAKERSSTSIICKGAKVIIEIKAQDLTALRACANSVLRLAQAIDNTDKVI